MTSSIWKRILVFGVVPSKFSYCPPKIIDNKQLNYFSTSTNIAPPQYDYNNNNNKIEVDNIFLRYKIAGHGSHAVLCLPGIIGYIEADYGPIFEKIDKQKFRIVSWDPPGYGQSRPPERDFTGDFYRRDAHLVAKLMEKLGIGRYFVLGWSNGGVTGGHLAADFPSRVSKLITWGAHSFADERAVMFSKMKSNLDLWSEKMKAPVLKIYGEEYLLKMLGEWGESVEAYYKAGSDIVFKDALTRITCPALIIHGELDPVLGVEHAEFLNEHIKNSKLFIMPGMVNTICIFGLLITF